MDAAESPALLALAIIVTVALLAVVGVFLRMSGVIGRGRTTHRRGPPPASYG